MWLFASSLDQLVLKSTTLVAGFLSSQIFFFYASK
jgi:hypothetical protein